MYYNEILVWKLDEYGKVIDELNVCRLTTEDIKSCYRNDGKLYVIDWDWNTYLLYK